MKKTSVFAFVIVASVLCSAIERVAVAQIVNEEKLPEKAMEMEARFITDSSTLTLSGGRAGEGYFSPDGKYMVFQSERVVGNPFYQIYRMDMENGKTKLISPGHGKTTCAWIHPLSGSIMFASTHDDPDALEKQKQEIIERETATTRRYAWSYDEHFDIYRWDAKTEKYTNLTNKRGYDAEGSYSPNGEWICFASNRQAYERELSAEEEKKLKEDAEYFMDLYIMKADGSEVTKITDKPGYDGGPFFSPDGSRICWRSFNEAGTLAEVWTMKLDGSDKKQLTRMNAMSWAPYYHPSGKYLIFTTNKHGYGNFELYLVDAEGLSQPRRVTFTKGFDGLPVFSPDGKQIVWSSERSSASSEKINSQRKPGAQLERADWNHAAALKSLGISETDSENLSVTPDQDQPESRKLGETAAGITSPDFNEEDIFRHVAYLCDPKLKGRMTGTVGERQATAYVAAYLDALGVEPAGDGGTWFQKFDYPAGAEIGAGCKLIANKDSLVVEKDWRPITFSQAGKIDVAEVVFAGYGIVAEKDEENAAYNSYIHFDVTDKWVMVFRNIPEDVSDERRQFLAIHANLSKKAMELRDLGAKGMIVVSGPKSHFKNKLVPLKNDFSRGQTSLAAISISDELAAKWLKLAGHDLAELQTQLDSGEQMMGIAIPELVLNANIDIKQNRGIGQNVVGRLQLGDKPSEEVIVIGAHVDHLGEGRSASSLASSKEKTLIHYGADDNASGVASVLEIAEHIAHLKRSGELGEMKRDFVFAAWSGEELGLHGSNHFVESMQKVMQAKGHASKADPHGTNPHGENPHAANPHGAGTSSKEANPHAASPESANPHATNPHGTNSKDSNPHGAGSNSKETNPHAANPHADNPHAAKSVVDPHAVGAHGNAPLPSIYPTVSAYLNMDMVGRYKDRLQLQGLGSSEDWGGLIETANFKTRFKIAKVMDTNLPTDATGFYKAGVPILAAFTGSHSDYHTPRDTPDKIKYPETARVAQLIGNLAMALSSRETPLTFKRHDESSSSRGSGGVMGIVYLGTHPDYAFEGSGVRITGVTEDSPSEKAGLGDGDVITELGGRKVENVNEYMFAIGGLRVGRETTVVVTRGSETVTLKITPGTKE